MTRIRRIFTDNFLRNLRNLWLRIFTDNFLRNLRNLWLIFVSMPRLLAIDYGTKRCGIAVSDPLQIIAQGLTTVHSKDILSFLETYFQKEPVETVIVGEPKRMSGEATDATAHVNSFVKKLKEKFPAIKIERIDERFTSKMAFQTMIDSGLKKKARQNKELIDEISATIILQSYMSMAT